MLDYRHYMFMYSKSMTKFIGENSVVRLVRVDPNREIENNPYIIKEVLYSQILCDRKKLAPEPGSDSIYFEEEYEDLIQLEKIIEMIQGYLELSEL